MARVSLFVVGSRLLPDNLKSRLGSYFKDGAAPACEVKPVALWQYVKPRLGDEKQRPKEGDQRMVALGQGDQLGKIPVDLLANMNVCTMT